MPSPKAQAEKEKGNACFKAGKYAEAVGHYTAAILADGGGGDYTFPLNRAAAYLRLGKNEDAERDCTAVLGMCPGNAKALYRRGQARAALGRVDVAEEDLRRALEREPANVAIQEELGKVTAALRERERERERKGEMNPKPKATQSGPAPQRRRVPITIVDAAASASTPPRAAASSTATVATTAPSTTAPDAQDTLRAVSTRPLHRAPPAPPAPVPASPVSPAPAATPPDPARTFVDAKRAREYTRPSRVGGGIFRASGENTVFPTRSVPVVASAGAGAGADSNAGAVAAVPAPAPQARPVVPVVPRSPPKTCFEFMRAWDASPDVDTRWGLLLSVPPSGVPALFKTSLEPAVLMSVLAVLRGVLVGAAADGSDDGVGARVRGYMDAFAEVERFATVVLFLSREERELARDVWEALGVKKEDVGGGAWKSVWK